MRADTKPDGEKYFEYVIIYVDDCLVILHKPESILREEIGRSFQTQGGVNRNSIAVTSWETTPSYYGQQPEMLGIRVNPICKSGG